MKKADVIDIIDKTLAEIDKEYKYTESAWEEGAKVSSLRFVKEIKEKVENLS